jgi:hypothetical protein
MANRFWVGGTGTWDSTNTTSWSTTTGGGGGASVPTSADTAIFDGASGGGTVTVAATINGTNSLVGITAGAFTGTLTFATNNPNVSISGQFSITGTGARTINLGSSTFTLTGTQLSVWDCATITNLTPSFASSTFVIAPSGFGAVTFASGGQTYGTVTVTSSSGCGVTFNGTGATIATLNITTGPVLVVFGQAFTITNAVAWTGASAAFITMTCPTGNTGNTSVTLGAAGTASWALIRGVTFVTNSLTATDSYSLGSVTNASITNPSGGVVGVIGG